MAQCFEYGIEYAIQQKIEFPHSLFFSGKISKINVKFFCSYLVISPVFWAILQEKFKVSFNWFGNVYLEYFSNWPEQCDFV